MDQHGKLPQPLGERGTALCIGGSEGTIRLLGMVNALQQRHTSVTLIAGDMTPNWYVPRNYCQQMWNISPPENILRVAEKRLPELIRSADQIFIAASAPMATTLVQMIRQIRLRGGKYVATAMPTTPLPCASLACQQCRVQTRHGPRLACQIGSGLRVHVL
jgi:hypothetical protein